MMSGMSMGDMEMQMWTTTDLALRVAMWAAMMIGMMIPSAAPMTLVYAAVARKSQEQSSPLPPTSVFVAGYVLIWTLFSVGAAVAQRSLDQAGLLSSTMASTNSRLGGALLLAAGIYQLTPLKQSCLRNCRSPADFLTHHWRGGGTAGALRLGVYHGVYCLGCCWVLMGLLFVVGVMNLVWVAVIAGFILVEKTLPFGRAGGRLAGAALIALGMAALTGTFTI
jgi:predicted metal-binding membrane protein